jgi:hypothetical protein
MTDEPVYVCGRTEALAEAFTARPWPVEEITWHLDTSGYRGNLSAEQLRAAFAEAFDSFAKRIRITPKMVASANQAMVRAEFGRIDGSGNTLAYSELSDGTTRPKGQKYDSGDVWVISEHPRSGIDAVRVMAHELGHMLGLTHDDVGTGALLEPTYSLNVRYPTGRDIDRLVLMGYRRRPILGPGPIVPTPVPPAPIPTPAPAPPAPTPTPAKPGGDSVSKEITKQIVDVVFGGLKKFYGTNMAYAFAIDSIHTIVLSLVDRLMAFTLPGGMTKETLKATVENIFKLAAEFFAGSTLMTMAVETFRATALSLIDQYVEELRVQGLVIAD